jgi:hypothetical protein
MSTTSAQPREPWRVEPPDHSPAAIRAELPEELRAQVDAEYLGALEAARTSFRLDRLDEVVQAWWLSGWARRIPGHQQAMETGRRFLAGETGRHVPGRPRRVPQRAVAASASVGAEGVYRVRVRPAGPAAGRPSPRARPRSPR